MYRAKFSCRLRPRRSVSINNTYYTHLSLNVPFIIYHSYVIRYLLMHKLSFLLYPSAHLIHISGPSPLQLLHALSQAKKVFNLNFNIYSQNLDYKNNNKFIKNI